MRNIPWLTGILTFPFVGWLWVSFARKTSFLKSAILFSLVTCLSSILLTLLFFTWGDTQFVDPWIPYLRVSAQNIALLPFTSLIALSIFVLSPKDVLNRTGATHVLFTLSATMAFFSVENIWLFGCAWLLSGWPIYAGFFKAPSKTKTTRGAFLFLLSSLAFLGLFLFSFYGLGISLSLQKGAELPQSIQYWFVPLFLLAIAVRMGLFPFHTWVLSSFLEVRSSSFLMVLSPISGAYALLRFRLLSQTYFIHSMFMWFGVLSAVYFFLVALAQKEQFRSVTYLVLGQMGLVFMGLVSPHQQSMTGALVLWLSLGVAGNGILLMSWNLQARRGQIMLTRFHGLVRSSPFLAGAFFLLGMGLIGLPGTLTFIAEDLLCQGILLHEAGLAILYVMVTALGAITFFRLFVLIFLGDAEKVYCADLERPQRIITLFLALTLFLPGMMPYPVITIPSDFIPETNTQQHTTNLPKPASIRTQRASTLPHPTQHHQNIKKAS